MLKFYLSSTLLAALAVCPASYALGQSQLILSLAGEAYDGPPHFEVRMGDQLVGAGTLTNALNTETEGRFYASAQPQTYLQDFVIELGDAKFSSGAEIILSLTNDKFFAKGLGYDRNIFVNFIEVNGKRVWARDLLLLDADGQADTIDYLSGLLPLYDGQHTIVARAPVDGWPAAGTLPGIESSAATKSGAIPLPQIRQGASPEPADRTDRGGPPNA